MAALRKVGFGVLLLFGLLALASGAGLLYLRSGAGQERLRRTLESQVNAAVQGTLSLQAARLSGYRLVLEGLRLKDPEGAVVAELERLEARLAPAALLTRHVLLREVRIVRPRLALREDPGGRGLNLSRALASREPESPPSKEPKSPSRWAITLDSLSLEDGAVELFDQAQLRALNASGKGSLNLRRERAVAELELTGAWTRPWEGPLTLKLIGHLRGERASLELDLASPGLQLAVRGGGRLTGEGMRARIQSFQLAPDAARALLPGYPLRVPLGLQGAVVVRRGALRTELTATAGGARAELKGTWDFQREQVEGLTASLREVNLRELFGRGPATPLSAELRGRGGAKSLDSLDGEAELEVPATRFEGQQLGPARLKAKASGGTLELQQLRAELPGLTVTANGTATSGALRLGGRLEASDLTRLSRALTQLELIELSGLAGAGGVCFSLEGAPSAPGLSLDGNFGRLEYGGMAARGVQLAARIPDLFHPLQSEGSLRAAAVGLGGRQVENVALSLVSRGRQLEAEVTAGGSGALSLHLGGQLDADRRGLVLAGGTLRFAGADWTQEQPARLRLAPEELALERLSFAAGEQRLALEGHSRPGDAAGAISVQRLNLAHLPSSLADAEWQLAGRLNAEVAIRSQGGRPLSGAGRLTLEEGRFRELTQLNASLEAQLQQDRARGALALRASQVELEGKFDLPVEGLKERRREPLSLTLQIAEMDLQRALAAIDQTAPLAGRASAALTVSGTARDPSLILAIHGRELARLTEGGTPAALGDADLEVRSDPQGKLNAALSSRLLGGTAQALLKTPYSAADLWRAPPGADAVAEAPLQLTAELAGVDLSSLADLTERPLSGAVSGKLEATGSLRRPRLTGAFTARGFALSPAPPADLQLDLSADEARTRASLIARRQAATVAELSARVEAPLARLWSGDARVRDQLAFALEARVTGFQLADLLFSEAPGETGKNIPRALLSAELRGEGRLGDPSLHLAGRAEQIQVGQLQVGRAQFDYRYARARSALTAALASRQGGALNLEASTQLDLSSSAWSRGPGWPRWKEAPLTASLDARGFDLAVLTGTLPGVRHLSGALTASGRVSGTLGTPDLRGELEWSDGQLGLDGLGDYRAIHLKADATRERIRIQQLTAQSGGGSMEFSADANRAQEVYAFNGQLKLDRFPIVFDDQLIAVLSMESALRGSLSDLLWDFNQVEIPRAQIDLPEVRRRDLQPLERPDDIVLLQDGKPVERRRRKSSAARAPSTEPESEDGSGSAGRRYWLSLRAPRNLWIRGTDINTEVGLSDGFRVEAGEETSLFGEIRFLGKGRVAVLGRKFEIQRDSQVRFTGPPESPAINLTAVYVNERESVTVYLTVRGQGTDITLNPTSEPPLPESEIYTLLATGRRSLKHGSGASLSGGDAASILGSYAAGMLKGALASKLPLDVLSIEAGGEGGLTGATVEAGTYVTDKIYLGYTGRLGANTTKENSNAVRLEYQFTPHWSLETEFGDAKVGGADLLWTRDF